jgi:ribosomal protein L14
MIQKLSKIKITDNSGAKTVQCINLKGIFASIGDIITVSVKDA